MSASRMLIRCTARLFTDAERAWLVAREVSDTSTRPRYLCEHQDSSWRWGTAENVDGDNITNLDGLEAYPLLRAEVRI